MPILQRLGFALGVLVMIALGATTYGSWRWGKGARALLARLEAARTPLTPRGTTTALTYEFAKCPPITRVANGDDTGFQKHPLAFFALRVCRHHGYRRSDV